MSETRKCRSCPKTIKRKGTRGPWPSQCDDCQGNRTPARRVVAATAVEPDDDVAVDIAPDATSLTALDVIDVFGLDYNLGNVTRFVLEREDGNQLENLQAARTYLDRAIAKLGGDTE